MPETSPNDARQRRNLLWVIGISLAALVFDGYDLVVYGTVVPTLLGDPSQLGELSPEGAGALGSYALVGVLVGALTAGAVGDRVGRRKVMLLNIAWFSVGMGATALTSSVQTFGLFRFFTGIGVGALVATVGALVAEFAPSGQRNRYNAIVYSGVPAGGVLAALVALALSGAVDWRGLFWVGACPIVLLLPIAWSKLPESESWAVARATETDKLGFPALATRELAFPTALLGLMSFVGLLLTYGLNTWLPQIMGENGYGKSYSLGFLLVLNLGAITGGLAASTLADRLGAKRIVASTFGLAAMSLAVLPVSLPFGLLLAAVAVAGVGTIGTQVLVYGLVSNYYPTRARAAGVAWCAGFGRLGGILGPILGGVLVGAGVGGTTAFYLFAGVSLVGGLVTSFVPAPRHEAAPRKRPEVGTVASTVTV